MPSAGKVLSIWPAMWCRLRALYRWAREKRRRSLVLLPGPILPPPPACALCDENTAPIGADDKVVRVLAFGGGGFDAVMQLGTIHALLVADATPPDLVVGISAGAVHAAALAEVLKADEPLRRAGETAERCREARMSRFRELLYEVQGVRARLRHVMLPDPFEADAGMALSPHHIASQHQDERSERLEAFRARSGLVELFNTVAKLHISVATSTRIIRCILGIRAAKALPRRQMVVAKLSETWRLLLTAIAHFPSTSQLLATTLYAALRGSNTKRRGYHAGDIIFRRTRAQRIAMYVGLAGLVWLLALTYFPDIKREVARHYHVTQNWQIVLIGAVGSVTILSLLFATIRALFYGTVGLTLLGFVLVSPRKLRTYVTDRIRDRVLGYYDLLVDLGSAYFVKDILIRFFDPEYHGAPQRPLAPASTQEPHTQKTFADFAAIAPKIHVAPVAARLADGELVPLDPQTSLVDGLAAATATLPYLRAVDIRGTFYIDGTNVANEPTAAVRKLLQQRVNPEATAVHIYPVSSLPIQAGKIPPKTDRPYAGLIDVLLRVRQLRRFRDAKLDRDITSLYNRMLPERRKRPERIPDNKIRALKCFGESRHYVRATIHPIEPRSQAITLAERLIKSRNRSEEHRAIAETVAQGCRLTLETILGDKIKNPGATQLLCRVAMERRFALAEGAMPQHPGVVEICKHCSLSAVEQPIGQTLETAANSTAAEWPVDEWYRPTVARPQIVQVAEQRENTFQDVLQPPTVSILFSGGVFRGVFLVGVLGALQELGIAPQLLAGSSVGSITAAMAARVFSSPPNTRRRQIAELAATYLDLDQDIVTDRFSDFIRRFTLRAAEARFTPKDIDNIFRNYDKAVNARFARRARRLIAGLEHLFYVSPFELLALLRALRLQDAPRAYRLVRRYFQEVLNRGGVGLEVLGTEPLRILISDHVLDERQRKLHAVPMQGFTPLHFLVTVTNLTTGTLQLVGNPTEPATLVEALLASSAYPGIFRPRFGWEVFSRHHQQDQLVDGGVMDNLPLAAVVDFLTEQTKAGKAAVHPQNAPHLIFTGSLERDPQHLDNSECEGVARSWPAAWRHAREHEYNRKIDSFARSQREFREIYELYGGAIVNQPWVPLDIEVLVAKPRWLCGTFAFHPMLGFRRDRQAASISHGCATTLATFAAVEGPARKWLTAWGVDADVRAALNDEALRTLIPVRKTDGTCHFRTTGTCPFSEQATSTLGTAASTKLDTIYQACGNARTHQALP